MRSALDVARNPQPYQIPLYYPPFPTLINQQPKQSGFDRAIAGALRNYQNVNSAELRRLRGDLTAYRQEQQTAFNTNVAYPRATVDVGSFDGASIDDDTNSVDYRTAVEPESDYTSSSSATTAAEPDSDYTPSSSEASTLSFGRAERLVAELQRMNAPSESESETPSALYRRAGVGAGRLTEPEMTTDTQFSPTDVSDFEGLTSGTSVGRGAGGGFKKVSFGEPMDLTEPESDFAPRASQSQRAARRKSGKVYVDNAANRRLGRVGQSY
tara:strand:- start:8646 stop:9452 length:807 start_codon:yes stop_codon:yes gene_type:complete